MKKILSIMLAGALIAGVAFADVSFTYTGTAIFGGTSKAISTADRNDCFNLELSNDIAGAVVDWDISDDQSGSYKVKKATANAATKDITGTVTTTSSSIGLDSYYAWMTFGLPVGNLQITTGKWASRLVNRVNTDAGDLDSIYYESYKPGAINGFIANDIDNLTQVGGSKEMSTVLAYTLADVLPGTFMAKFGLVDASSLEFDNIFNDETDIKASSYNTLSEYSYEDLNSDGDYDDTDETTPYTLCGTDTAETTLYSGFVGELSYSQEKLFSVNVAVKNNVQDMWAFGIFASPLMVEKLSATVGFSMGTIANQDTYDYSEWGVDLRARYAITDKLAITTMNNISGYKLSPDGEESTDDKAMWNMLSAAYKAGDNIRFIGTVQNTVNSFDAVKATDSVFAISPVCEIKPTDKATVTCGFDIRWTNMTPFAGVGDVSLPIYFSFAL